MIHSKNKHFTTTSRPKLHYNTFNLSRQKLFKVVIFNHKVKRLFYLSLYTKLPRFNYPIPRLKRAPFLKIFRASSKWLRILFVLYPLVPQFIFMPLSFESKRICYWPQRWFPSFSTSSNSVVIRKIPSLHFLGITIPLVLLVEYTFWVFGHILRSSVTIIPSSW